MTAFQISSHESSFPLQKQNLPLQAERPQVMKTEKRNVRNRSNFIIYVSEQRMLAEK